MTSRAILNGLGKRRLCDLDLDNYADMVYLTVGDPDIPAEIPSRLRTL